jgi:hypothetical protein
VGGTSNVLGLEFVANPTSDVLLSIQCLGPACGLADRRGKDPGFMGGKAIWKFDGEGLLWTVGETILISIWSNTLILGFAD